MINLLRKKDFKWDFKPDREPFNSELKILIATALQIAVEVVFSNYIYSFGGVHYRQVKVGPIGSSLTMELSRIIMGR